MAEPALPVISQSIRERKPKPSGICPPKALALMFGAGLPISVVVGVIAHYVGILVGWLGGLIAALPSLLFASCGFVACGAVIFALTVIAVVVFGYPIVVGAAAGAIIGWLGKSGNCRNTTAAGLAGAFSGIVAYAAHTLVAFLVYGSLHVLTVNVSTLESLFDVTLQGTPVWMYILVAIEAIIVIVASAIVGSSIIQDATFCEAHGVWYGPWRETRVPVELAGPIAQMLETSMLQESLGNVVQLSDKDFPHLLIRTRKCPTSPACDVEAAGKVAWQETKVDKKGKESTSQHTKDWFDTLVPPDLGRMLEKALYTEQDTTKA